MELTRTKELVDKYEEEAESLKQNSRDNERTITDLQNQCRESRQQLNKIQTVSIHTLLMPTYMSLVSNNEIMIPGR